VVPFADFSGPSSGMFSGDGFSIEISMGDSEIVQSIGLHVRGGDGAETAAELKARGTSADQLTPAPARRSAPWS
jgi:hypothetical protein